jgi:hypothetical protein
MLTGEGRKLLKMDEDDPEESEEVHEMPNDDDLTKYEEMEKSRCRKLMDWLIIKPKKLWNKIFSLIVAFAVYYDFTYTCFLIGNYKFVMGYQDHEYTNYKMHYTYLISIQGLDIILNFFRKEDYYKNEHPCQVAYRYITSNFLIDFISLIPWFLL